MSETEQKKFSVSEWLVRFTSSDYWKGLAVVAAASILAATPSLLSASNLTAGGLAPVMAIVSAVVGLVSWLVSTAIVHGVSRLLGGAGDFKRFIAMNGFAYSPLMIQSLLGLAIIVIVGAGSTPAAGRGIVDILLDQFNVLRLLFIALSTVAVSVSYGFTKKKALLVVLIPVALSIAFSLLMGSFALGVGQIPSGGLGLFGGRGG